MSASAAIADPLLRRAFGLRARPSDPHRTLGTGALLLGACPRLRSGTGTAADVGASPLSSARRSHDAAQRFRDEPSRIMRALSGRILHQACAHCPLGGRFPGTQGHRWPAGLGQARSIWSVSSVWSVSFIWLFGFSGSSVKTNQIDQMNQTDRTDQMNKTDWRTFSASCYRMN